MISPAEGTQGALSGLANKSRCTMLSLRIIVRLAQIVCLAALFSSCSLFSGFTSTITFYFDMAADTTGANEVAMLDATADNRTMRRQPLKDGLNEVVVGKSGSYILALVASGAASRSPVASDRSISGGITTIGNISIISAGIDSIPMGNTASDAIPLGPVSIGSDSIVSEEPLQSLSTSLNQDEDYLLAYGRSDDLLLKFMNPDINRNGVYDTTERLEWSFQASYSFAQSYGNADFDSKSIPFGSEELKPIVRQYFFTALRGFGDIADTPITEVRLVPPTGHDMTWQSSGTPLEYIPVTTDQYMGGVPQIWFPQQFRERADTGVTDSILGTFPANGDYVVWIGADSYYIDHARFIVPGNNYDALIFPLFKLTFDGDLPDRIEWRWYVQNGGTFIPASPERVSAVIRQFHFAYAPAGGGPNTIFLVPPDDWSDGSSMAFTDDQLNLIRDPSIYILNINFVDFAGNNFFWMQSNGGPGMAETIEGFGLEARP